MATKVPTEEAPLAGREFAVEEVEEITMGVTPRGRARRVAALAGASLALGAAAMTTALVVTRRDALRSRLRVALCRPLPRRRGLARFAPSAARPVRLFALPGTGRRRRLARLTQASRRIVRRVDRRRAAR